MSNVAHLLAGPVAERPDAPALIEAHRVTTFAQLDLSARRVAALLRARGVGVGDGVLFFEPPSAELYASLAAVFRLGAVAMFVEPSAGRAVLDAACAMWPPKALIATPKAHLLRLVSRALWRVPVKVATRGRVLGAWSLRDLGGIPPLPPDAVAPVDGDAPALLTFTSGSTGAPKAAVRTHGILRAQLDALGAELTARPGECEMVSLPIVVLLNLAGGATTILPDADLRRPGAIDPGPVLTQLAHHRASRITASPAFLERLADSAGPGGLAPLDAVVTGGGPVFPDIVARVKAAAPYARVVSVYGSTEAEPIAHVADDETSEADETAMRAGVGLLAGLPDSVVRLRIVRARWGTPIPPLGASALDAMTVPTGEAGEIVVTGPHVVRGYLHGLGDAETKFRVGEEIWHRTGDLGRLDDRGRLWLLGRASAAIEDDRGTLHPFTVECAARMLLGGRRVAVAAHEGRRVLVTEGDVDADALRASLAWAKLDEVRSVARIPMDRRHNSKVDYGALASLLAGRRR